MLDRCRRRAQSSTSTGSSSALVTALPSRFALCSVPSISLLETVFSLGKAAQRGWALSKPLDTTLSTRSCPAQRMVELEKMEIRTKLARRSRSAPRRPEGHFQGHCVCIILLASRYQCMWVQRWRRLNKFYDWILLESNCSSVWSGGTSQPTYSHYSLDLDSLIPSAPRSSRGCD